MISKITGTIKGFRPISVLIETHGICYDVYVPKAILKMLEQQHKEDETISLVTYHFHQTDPSRSIPVLIGFVNEIEKEFFEQFITVSGIGPRAAVKSLSLPFSTIAQAIHEADLSVLRSLPGIGPQRAREIIAKLQGKMGKFGLIQDIDQLSKVDGVQKQMYSDSKEEALTVLLQLQYKQAEALKMIEAALGRNDRIKSCEDLLNEVYRQRQVGVNGE